ncbi:MAG TPA: hypothetical protein VFV96_01270 [Verrucomicrobiae bacterium]|nr:hypothetical protein [Verrucomicrobiae bacterium]
MADKSFWITSFEAEQSIENRLSAAGEDFHGPEIVIRRLSALASFLDRNGLATRRLTNAEGQVDKDFVLESADLTSRGLHVIRCGYEKWQRRAKTPEDVTPLEKELAKLQRTENNRS